MTDGSLPLIWRNFSERYNLLGSKCKSCGKSFFPTRLICPNCRTKGKLVAEQMPFTGKIVSWTKVFVGPQGFDMETPYFLALIELDNGAMILSQLVDNDDGKVKTGARVEKVFRKLQDNDAEGAIAYGYKFRVTG